jgi:hypothetical protein
MGNFCGRWGDAWLTGLMADIRHQLSIITPGFPLRRWPPQREARFTGRRSPSPAIDGRTTTAATQPYSAPYRCNSR